MKNLIYMRVEEKTVQQTLFGEEIPTSADDYDEEFEEINIDEFKGKHKCPLCGFEWDD